MNRAPTAQRVKTTNVLPPVEGILQRKCACGNHTAAGKECAECAKSKRVLQRKLTIGASNDPLEREADRVSDQVMAASAHSSVIGAPLHIQRFSGRSSGQMDTTAELASVDKAIASPGRPLAPPTRQDMEQRFGYDFSRVRVHTGAVAAQSAEDVNAHAYTAGHNIVFGAARYAPETDQGRRLIAHELTHVVQQNSTGQPRVQRHTLENDPSTAPSMSCQVADSSPSGTSLDVFFDINSSELSAAEQAAISNFVRNWHAAASADPVRIDGFASIDGAPSTNWPISCSRAETMAREIMSPSDGTPGIPANHITVFAQGETDEFSAVLDDNRRAQAHIPAAPQPAPPTGTTETREITVQPVAVANDDGTAPTAVPSFAESSAIWRKCCINLRVNSTQTVNRTAFKELEAPAACTPQREASDLATAAAVSGSVISVFVPDTFRDGTSVGKNVSGGGFATDASTSNPKVFIVSGAHGTVLAHELGHAMGHASCLGRSGHSPSGTVMVPSGAHDAPIADTSVAAIICTHVQGFSGASGSGRNDCTEDFS